MPRETVDRMSVGDWAVVGAALIIACAAVCSSGGACAQGVRIELALAVAKVCVNEAGFDSPADCALVWQAAEANASTPAGRLRWLRAHSGRVLGSRPCRTGNCLWSRGLSWSDDRPFGWPDGLRWRWRAWRRVRGLALRLVDGEELRRPCAGRPVTWGGPMDREAALAAGMVMLACVGTRNDGWAWPRREVVAFAERIVQDR